MFAPSPSKRPRLPQSIEAIAADFERSKIDEIRSSRKTAWAVAGAALTISLIAIIALLVAILIRPEPEPTIIKVDKSTGAAEVLRSVKDTQDRYDEVLNNHWLATYVQLREGYDWFTISEAVDSVKLMSESNVASEYDRRVRMPDAPLATLKDKGRIAVRISSMTYIGDLAQIRFTSQKQSMTGESIDGMPEQNWIATVAFKFDSGWMTPSQRRINPLGFKVLSYRVDPEAVK